MIRFALLLTFIAAATLTTSASGSGAGSAWSRVTDMDAAAGVGLARTADGTLHVLWAKGGAVYDTRIASKGVGARTTVVSGWSSTAAPAAIVQAGGSLRAFVTGSIRSSDIGDAVGVHTLTAPASGAAWTLDIQAVWGGALANQRDVTAVLGKDGAPVTAVGGGGAVFFRGVQRGQQATILPPAPYSYDPEVAVDAGSGAIVASWYIDQGGRRGIVTQSVFPGGPQQFVGNADDAVDGGVSGRSGAPGVYVVVSSPAGVRFGRVGGALRLVAKDSGVAAVDVTAGPEGRLWISWLSTDGKLHAMRTNRAASRFGPPQSVKAPAGSPTSFELRGEGSSGPLDALARYRTSAQAWWHTRLVPPLAVSAVRSKKGVVTVRVTDVGDPVKGATVTVAGKKATTDAKGVATFVGVASSGSAQAGAAGYSSTTGRFH